jgi:hypothetical protein
LIFKRLLKWGWDKRYFQYIQKQSFSNSQLQVVQVEFLKLLKCRHPKLREKMWQDIWNNHLTNLIQQKKEYLIDQLANPYFIGFGNPASDILFVGKEKAIDHNFNEILIKESINNVVHWEFIFKQPRKSRRKSKRIFTRLGFNPLIPTEYCYGRAGFQGKKPDLRGTWGLYAKICRGVQHPEVLEEENLKKLEKEWLDSTNNSFFKHCFCTEINHIPSVMENQRVKKKLIDERKKLLKNRFYQSFSKIVVAAGSYLTEDECKNLFDIDSSFECKEYIFLLGKNKTEKLILKVYKNDYRRFIYCSRQLSQGAGWTHDAVSGLIKQLK